MKRRPEVELEKEGLDSSTRRPVVTSKRSFSIAEPEGGGLRSEWEAGKQGLFQ